MTLDEKPENWSNCSEHRRTVEPVSRTREGVDRMSELATTIPATSARHDTVAPGRRYCLITPVRDEEKYARRTLDSVVKQSVLPALWVIVDDGSKDATPAILAEYAAKHPWIRVVRRADRGSRKLGGGVIDAFYTGYETITPAEYDYVCKLDLDLDIPPRYFEILMQPHGSGAADRYVQRQAIHGLEWPACERDVRRREFRRHDQVLPHDLLQADRRVRAVPHVGRHRRAPVPHAGLGRGELGRTGPAVHPLAPHGHQRQELVGPVACVTGWDSTTWGRASLTCWSVPCSA